MTGRRSVGEAIARDVSHSDLIDEVFDPSEAGEICFRGCTVRIGNVWRSFVSTGELRKEKDLATQIRKLPDNFGDLSPLKAQDHVDVGRLFQGTGDTS